MYSWREAGTENYPCISKFPNCKFNQKILGKKSFTRLKFSDLPKALILGIQVIEIIESAWGMIRQKFKLHEWNIRMKCRNEAESFFVTIICVNFIFCKKKEVWKYQTVLWRLYFVFMKWGRTRKLSSYQKTFPRYIGLIKVNYKGNLMQMLHYKRHLCTVKTLCQYTLTL